MHRLITTLVKLATVGSLGLIALGTTGCYADVYTDPAYYPSDAYVATSDPVYYEGRPMYWYGGRWYYRDGARWSYYRSEPGYLRNYRGAHPEIGRPRGGGRAPAPRGGGGYHGRR